MNENEKSDPAMLDYAALTVEAMMDLLRAARGEIEVLTAENTLLAEKVSAAVDRNAVSGLLQTWPTRIWLQWNPDELEEYPGASEDLTWCDDNVHNSDVEYVRADLAAPVAQPSAQTTPQSLAPSGAVTEALKQLMSIVDIYCDSTGENFAWAEMSYAHEVLTEAPASLAAQSLAPSGAMPEAEFLVSLLKDRINFWESYIAMVEKSKNGPMPIGGTDEGDCKVRVQKAKALLTYLAASAVAQPERSDAPAGVVLTDAARDVLAERQRQKNVEGWSPAHDDKYTKNDLAQAAAAYAIINDPRMQPGWIPGNWPWSLDWWKPTTPRQNIVKAAALLLADIERMDRLAAPSQQPTDSAAPSGDEVVG